MKSRFINVLMFAAGAAIGSAVTWKFLKTKYERITQEEIDSVIERFSGNELDVPQETPSDDTEDDEPQKENAGQFRWRDLVNTDEENESDNSNAYERVVTKYTDKKGGAGDMPFAPYVIAPYEFGELDDYSQVELTYYADDVLEDESYNIIHDRDELIGPKALTTFGEYEDDAVFVRNEYLRADFQILKDYRTYAEARSVGPKRVDDE